MINRPIFSYPGKRQKGFSLLEILIVAGLLAAGLAALFFMLNRYNVRAAANNEAEVLNTMAAETRTQFRSQGNYTGVTPAVLIANGIVPTTHVNGTAIETGWATTVAVAPANLNGTMGDSVSFTYTLPRESCSRFVQASEGAFSRVIVGGVHVKDIPTGARNLNVATLGTQCNAAAAAGGNVTVVFTLGR